MALQIPGYQIIRKIAQGGMSTVYLAIQISVGRVVALKVMTPNLSSDPSFNERFQREATIVGQLSHPNIVSVYDIGRQGNLNYIAMDYLAGGSVHDRMIKGLTTEEALRITKEIASALDHAHEKGYVHRDIKPENILFRADNSAVLSDFGVAKGIIGASRMTHVGSVVGTPHYMAPEQARGQNTDARSDLYSLGVVFYEMLTGSLPYQGEDAVAIALKHIGSPVPILPPHLQAFQSMLEKFLAKDPTQRFQQGRDIVAAIEQLQSIGATSSDIVSIDLSISDLFRALVSRTGTRLKWHWKNIARLRWSRERGFYHRPLSAKSQQDVESSPTLFNTQIQHERYLDQIVKTRRYRLLKWIFIVSVLAGVWFIGSWMLNVPIAQQKIWVAHWLDGNQTSSVKVAVHSSSAASSFVASSEASSLVENDSQIATLESNSSASEISSENSAASSSSSVANLVAEQTSSAAKKAFALTVKTTPEKATVRILNIAQAYKEGLELKNGKYHLEISRAGYTSKDEWIEIKDQPMMVVFQLEKSAVDSDVEPVKTKSSTTTSVKTEKSTPEMVRVSAGFFIMGDDSLPTTSPAHKVSFSKSFAVSKYEITFAQYDKFAEETNRALPGDNGWGRDNHPVINVSWDDAQAYTQWLSKITGRKYHLPTEAEWEYIARAGTKTRYWWGDSELEAKGNANCRRGCYSSYSGMFGSKTAPVGSYSPNPFGIYDTAGNVSEWVQDCYKENYQNASYNGSAYEEKNCAGHVVRGGSTKDNVQHISSTVRDDIPQGFLNETIGFRVVMELN